MEPGRSVEGEGKEEEDRERAGSRGGLRSGSPHGLQSRRFDSAATTATRLRLQIPVATVGDSTAAIFTVSGAGGASSSSHSFGSTSTSLPQQFQAVRNNISNSITPNVLFCSYFIQKQYLDEFLKFKMFQLHFLSIIF